MLQNAIITPVALVNSNKLVISLSNFSENDSRPGYTLRLSRFRKIKNLEVTLPPDGIILLDGRSGIGKTSILEAISFVLYDDAGNTCYPRNERASKKKHGPTWVELTFPTGLIIYRQRRPNLLRILDVNQNIDLMDDSAKFYINRIFGPLNNWLVGGYLTQGELCAFFSMSSDDKLNLLQQIPVLDKSSGMIVNAEIFGTQLNRTVEKISVISRQIQEVDMQVKIYFEMYMRLYNQCTEEIRSRKLWTSEETSELLQKYQVFSTGNYYQELISKIKTQSYSNCQLIRSQISEAQIQVAKNNESMKQRFQLQELLKNNEIQLENFSEDNSENVSRYEKDLIDINEQISLAKRTERRSQLLAAKTEVQRRLDLIPNETSKYSWSDLDKYDKILSWPTIEQAEEQLKEIILVKEYQQQLEIYQKYQNTLKQVENFQRQLDSYPKDSVNDQIEDITKKIWMLNLQQKKLTCPKCFISLQLNDGKLDFMDTCLNDEHIEGLSLTDLTIQKSKYQQIESQYQQRGHVEKSLDLAQKQLASLHSVDLPPKPKLADYNSYQLDGLVAKLNEIKKSRESLPLDLNVKIEREKFTFSQERARLIHDIESISKELTGLTYGQNEPIEIKILETRRSEITLKLSELRSQEIRRATLLATKEQLLNQLKSYPERSTSKLEMEIENLKSELETIIQKSEKLEQDINAQIQVSQLVELYNQHNQYQKVQQELTQRSMAFQKIKATLITAEYIILDNVLSEINRTIEEVLDILFIEPISVTIRSLRQLKTDDRIKPQINCQIISDGAECSKITELSGGERIRVSLALAIAFSQFNNAPFFILDESLSTLDALTKESTIKMLKKYLPNKLIITVNHDTTVGVYNSVMHLTNKGD